MTIQTILDRIAANNNVDVPRGLPFTEGLYAGRIEAYEDVLRLLGFYNEDDEPRYQVTP
jgi:hypothetical protein